LPKRRAAKPGPAAPTESVDVTIGGRSYRLRGTDPDSLRDLADQVDRTLAELAGPNHRPDDFKLAVLAALNIAGEQQELRAEWLEQTHELRRRSTALTERLQKLRGLADAAMSGSR